ncbi:DsrE family protein [candidate division TA06 bacterium]|nr:DsrE family protein [candidate division TA06 bacterium]
MRICVVVAYSKDNVDKATIGFTLANAALESGEKLSVILVSEGVRLVVKGYADDINNGEPFKPMKPLIEEVLEKGGEINVCAPCMKKRGIQEKDLLGNLKLIAGPDVIRILKESDRSIQL